MASRQTLRLGLVLLIAGVVATSVVIATSVGADEPTGTDPVIPEWPPCTMVYETDGIVYSIGSSPPVNTREVRRLEYQSRTQWTDTVVEAPTITHALGSDSRVGFSARLNGGSYTEYDASGETTYAETLGENEIRIAGSLMLPFPIEESGVETEPAVTSAKVCFNDECTENAAGLLYKQTKRSELVLVDDARGIPLRVNDVFFVKEIHIEGAKQQIAR